MADLLNGILDPEAERISARRALANSLLSQGQQATAQPMRSDWQMLASILQTGLGAYLGMREDAAAKALGEKYKKEAAGFNPMAGLLTGGMAPAPGGAAPAAPAQREEIPAPPAAAPQQRGPLSAALSGGPAAPSGMYGRNASLVAGRDAMLGASPVQLAAASQERATATNGIPAGASFAANPGLGGAYAGLPAPSGRVAVLGGGSPPPAQMQAAPQQPAAQAPAQAPAPQGMDLNAVAMQIAQGLNSPNPLIRQQAAAYAQMLPGLRASQERGEDRAWQREQADRSQGNTDRAFGAQQQMQAAQLQMEQARLAIAREEAARRGREGGPQAGLNPIWATGPDGRPTLVMPRTDGTLVQPQLPPGVTLMPPTRDINLGTSVQTVDRGGNTVATRSVDVAGRERAEAVGQAQGQQEAAAPQAARTAEQTLAAIDGVLNHPALSWGTGMTGQVANAIPGTPTYDFGQRVEQLRGQAFLQAFNSLRGSGAITEAEGRKATDAIGRLSTGNSPEAFRTALGELRNVVLGAQQRANTQSGGAPAGGQAAPTGGNPPRVRTYNPTTGRLE